MPIQETDVLLKLSTKSGSAGNSLTSTPAASLGKYISQTELVSASLHNLFDVVTGDENAASDVEYRCIFVHNNHATLTHFSVVAWLVSEASGGCSIAVAVDGVAASVIGSASAQADEVATESVAPTGETFSSPSSKVTGISLGDIPAGQCKALWVRRTAAASAAKDSDDVYIRVEGDTGE
jgi:hypothetical protein